MAKQVQAVNPWKWSLWIRSDLVVDIRATL